MATLNATCLSCVLVLTACQMDQNENSVVGSEQQYSASFNGASFNGASFNGASFNGASLNGASFNGASFNGASFNGASFNGLDFVADTADGREFLTYFSRCALNDGATANIADSDGVNHTFPGLLGLASGWGSAQLTEAEKKLVSACLIAHINVVGATIAISLRNVNSLAASPAEMEQFKVYEGTFFGSLHTEDVVYYSCLGDDANVGMALSNDRVNRLCADESDECDIVSLGRCRDVCDTRDANYGWTGCWANGERFDETLSVYLRSSNNDNANKTCDDGDCTLKIKNNKAGILDCSDADDCKAVCKGDSVCAIDGTAADEVRAVVKSDSIADINCHEANECSVKAISQSSVEIDCKDANDCSDVVCKGGADCLLDCTGAVDCGFDVCQGEVTYCPGDIMVCGRGCP